MTERTLAHALREMTEVTRPRPNQDEESVEICIGRLYRVLREFPDDVALRAVDEWPRRNQFFPTECELRVQCDNVIADMARAEAASNVPREEGRFSHPVGRSEYFVNQVRKRFGDAYVKSWMSGGINALFSDNVVYVTIIGHERLMRDCHDLAHEASIWIVASDECLNNLNRYCERMERDFPTKKRWRL